MNKYGYEYIKVFDNTYRIMDNPSTSEFLIVGSEKCLLVDTGLGVGDLRALVDELCEGKPVIVVNTHGHFDHIWANNQFEEVYLSEEDEAFSNKSNTKEYKEMVWNIGGTFFKDEKHYQKILNSVDSYNIKYLNDIKYFDLGDTRIEVIKTAGHTIGSYSFLDTKNKRLFTGDAVLRFESLANGNGSSINEYVGTLKSLLARKADFDWMIGAHGHRTDGFRPLEHEYLQKLLCCIDSINLDDVSGPGEHFIDEVTFEYYLDHKKRSDYDAVSITFSKSQYEQYVLEKNKPAN